MVRDVASGVFKECSVGDCEKFSLGFVCSQCSRFACNNHLYFKMGAPPKPVCAACVVLSHEELLEDV